MKLVCMILIGLVGLAGCGDGEPEPAEPEHVFDPMVETLDRAKAVQGLEQDHKRQIDEQLENN